MYVPLRKECGAITIQFAHTDEMTYDKYNTADEMWWNNRVPAKANQIAMEAYQFLQLRALPPVPLGRI